MSGYISQGEAAKKFLELYSVGLEKVHLSSDPGSTNMLFGQVFAEVYVQMRAWEEYETQLRHQLFLETERRRTPWIFRWMVG